jgi:hypothetical protein
MRTGLQKSAFLVDLDKSLDIFHALGVKDVYASKRKQGESEH